MRPVDNEYISLAINRLLSSRGDGEATSFKIVFSKDCGQDLMRHASGPLKGLKTTSIVRDGKIVGTAGLEKNDQIEENAYLFLSIALFLSVSKSIGDVARSIAVLHKVKLREKQAKFERIGYIIKNTFDIMPELLVDGELRAAYLNQMIACNNDCYELFVFFREEFEERCREVRGELMSGRLLYWQRGQIIRGLLTDNVFGAFERFAVGKLCEVFITRNFTSTYLNSARNEIDDMRNSLMSIFDDTIGRAEEIFRERWKYECGAEDRLLEEYVLKIDDIVKETKDSLSSKVDTFDLLKKKLTHDEIEVTVKDGSLLQE
ncbi:hypothetical protein [Paraburkholderia sp. GAS199]|uniref:hypothetical protein n=1 Tax=Paraburkholderia sp. GAS199 TaxID=3035126 RepID=UPI003D247B3B